MAPRNHRLPSFFKVMVGDFNKRVKIPTEFIKHMNGRKLPSKSILRRSDHKSWEVEVKKSLGHFFFRTGWSEFVKDNALQVGDFVVFRCDDKLNFDVIILGQDACEKEFTECEELKPEVKKEEEAEPSIPSPCLCSYIPVTRNAGRSIFDAGSCPFKVRNPHFAAVLKLETKYRIRIPKLFGIETGLWPSSRKRMCISDPSGRSWPVSLILHDKRSNRGSFVRGWRDVVKSNALVLGDVCIFEVIDNGKGKEVSLHIHRGRGQG